MSVAQKLKPASSLEDIGIGERVAVSERRELGQYTRLEQGGCIKIKVKVGGQLHTCTLNSNSGPRYRRQSFVGDHHMDPEDYRPFMRGAQWRQLSIFSSSSRDNSNPKESYHTRYPLPSSGSHEQRIVSESTDIFIYFYHIFFGKNINKMWSSSCSFLFTSYRPLSTLVSHIIFLVLPMYLHASLD